MRQEPVDVGPAARAARLQHELGTVLDHPKAPARLLVQRVRIGAEGDRIEQRAQAKASVRMPLFAIAVGDPQHEVPGGARWSSCTRCTSWAAGEALLAPSVTRRIVEQFARRPVRPELGARLDGLTAREREVLRMLAHGKSNAELAVELFVSEGTIKTHVSSLLAKLGLRDRVQAVVLAYESGLVTPGS